MAKMREYKFFKDDADETPIENLWRTSWKTAVKSIQNKIKDIAKFICDHYVDEKGNELSMQTIQTYLSPTRTDKNPNNDWKIKL